MTTRQIALAIAFASSVACAAQPDDARIARTLDQALTADPSLRDIDANSSKGEVTLTGSVPSELDRSRAGDLAERVDGVATVHNEITIATMPVELPPVSSPPPTETAPNAAPEMTPEATPDTTGDAPAAS